MAIIIISQAIRYKEYVPSTVMEDEDLYEEDVPKRRPKVRPEDLGFVEETKDPSMVGMEEDDPAARWLRQREQGKTAPVSVVETTDLTSEGPSPEEEMTEAVIEYKKLPADFEELLETIMQTPLPDGDMETWISSKMGLDPEEATDQVRGQIEDLVDSYNVGHGSFADYVKKNLMIKEVSKKPEIPTKPVVPVVPEAPAEPVIPETKTEPDVPGEEALSEISELMLNFKSTGTTEDTEQLKQLWTNMTEADGGALSRWMASAARTEGLDPDEAQGIVWPKFKKIVETYDPSKATKGKIGNFEPFFKRHVSWLLKGRPMNLSRYDDYIKTVLPQYGRPQYPVPEMPPHIAEGKRRDGTPLTDEEKIAELYMWDNHDFRSAEELPYGFRNKESTGPKTRVEQAAEHWNSVKKNLDDLVKNNPGLIPNDLLIKGLSQDKDGKSLFKNPDEILPQLYQKDVNGNVDLTLSDVNPRQYGGQYQVFSFRAMNNLFETLADAAETDESLAKTMDQIGLDPEKMLQPPDAKKSEVGQYYLSPQMVIPLQYRLGSKYVKERMGQLSKGKTHTIDTEEGTIDIAAEERQERAEETAPWFVKPKPEECLKQIRTDDMAQLPSFAAKLLSSIEKLETDREELRSQYAAEIDDKKKRDIGWKIQDLTRQIGRTQTSLGKLFDPDIDAPFSILYERFSNNPAALERSVEEIAKISGAFKDKKDREKAGRILADIATPYWSGQGDIGKIKDFIARSMGDPMNKTVQKILGDNSMFNTLKGIEDQQFKGLDEKQRAILLGRQAFAEMMNFLSTQYKDFEKAWKRPEEKDIPTEATVRNFLKKLAFCWVNTGIRAS